MRIPLFIFGLIFSFWSWAETPSNVSRSLENMKLVPHFNEETGEMIGFRAVNVTTENKLYQFGIREGDVIKRINGEPIDNPLEAMEFYSKLKKGDRIELLE